MFQTTRSKLSLLEDTSRVRPREDNRMPISTRSNSRHGGELFKNIFTLREELRRDASDKTKVDNNPTYINKNRESSTKIGQGISGLSSERHQQSSSVHKDLMNAVRGISSSKDRSVASKESNSNRISVLSQAITKPKTSEPINFKHASQLSFTIMDKLSKNSLSIQSALTSPQETFRAATVTNNTPEKNGESLALKQ